MSDWHADCRLDEQGRCIPETCVQCGPRERCSRCGELFPHSRDECDQAQQWRWSNKGGVLILYRGGEHGVVLRTQPQKGTDYDLTEEDAALISAAPDMKAALEAARDIMGAFSEQACLDGCEHDDCAEYRRVQGVIDEAIRKAEGR